MLSFENSSRCSASITSVRGHKWVHCLSLFSFVLGNMSLSHTCKILSFLRCLDNFLLKNMKTVIVSFFGNQISKWRSFEKRAILTYFSHFLVQGKENSFSTYLIYIHTRILLTLLTFFFFFFFFFFAIASLQKLRIYQVRFLFGVTPGVNSYSRHFGAINK